MRTVLKPRRSLLAVLPFVAAASLGVALHRSCAPQGAAASPAAPAAISAPAPRAEAASASRAAAAERRVYAVTLSQSVTLGGETFATAALTARLSLMPIPGTPLVEARLVDPSVEITGQEPPRDEDLRRAVLLARDGEGRLEGLRFAPGTGEPARLLLTTLAAATQITRGEGARWTTTEEDGTGTYRADYERDGDGAIERRKRGYLHLREGLTPVSVEGDLRVVLDGRDGIESLAGRETLSARPSAAFGDVRGELEVSLRLVDRADATPAELAAARARAEDHEPAQMAVPRGDREDGKRKIDERRAAGQRLDDLRRAFGETTGSGRRDPSVGQQRAELIRTAAALFRVRPEEALAAGRTLASRDVPPDEANFLAGALAAAGTEEAAHALAAAVTSPDATGEARRQAAVSLGLAGVGDEATVAALSEGARSDDPDLRSMSTLALGSQAKALAAANGGPDADLDPVADLLADLAAATDDTTRRLLLAALGNSGDARAFEPLRASLSSPALAPVATYGLRFLPLPAADDLLHELTAKADVHVRIAAYRAAAHRDAALWLPRLEAALPHEKDPKVAAAIEATIDLLGAP